MEVARGIMETLTDPKIEMISVMGPTQLLKTELLNNIVGFYIHQDPSPILLVQPSKEAAENWSQERLDPMVRDTPVLHKKVSDKKSRDSGNTLRFKKFDGGFIAMEGSNSPTGLAMRPIKILLMDEVDKYPESAGKEGDPVKLAEKRTETFWDSKIVKVCSPTLQGRSRIENAYLEGDQRIFRVPCPHCHTRQEMLFKQVIWQDDNPDTAKYHCVECDKPWTEAQRLKQISKGKWRATKPTRRHASFRTSKLVSPWKPLSALVEEYLAAVRSGDSEKLKVFINTALAQTWKEKSERPDWHRLYERREHYQRNVIPKDVAFLTCGIDVQKDRFELEIVGWSKNLVSYSIDYRVIPADTSELEDYEPIEKLLTESFKIEDSEARMGISISAIDSGYESQTIYNFVRKFSSRRLIAVKGKDEMTTMVAPPTRTDVRVSGVKLKSGVNVWPVGVSIIKEEVYSFLKKDAATEDQTEPYGYCHFPQYGEEYFKMLTAEELVSKKDRKGNTKTEWHKHRERNEALDARVYARAAAHVKGIDRADENQWTRWYKERYTLIEPEKIIKKQKPATSSKKPKKRKKNSSWL